MSMTSCPGIRMIPFVRILIPFFLGDLIGLYVTYPFLWVVILLITGMVMYIYSVLDKHPEVRYAREGIGGMGILWLFFSAGILASGLAVEKMEKKRDFDGEEVIAGMIYQPAVQKKNSCESEISVYGIRKDRVWYKVNGRALLRFNKNSRIVSGKPGETILLYVRLIPFPYYGNPGEFNYSRYQADHGIYWQAFVKEENWRYVPEKSFFSVRTEAKKVQYYLVNCLKKYGFSQSSLALASALTAGDRDYMDPHTRKYFADSGTMHVLAISGLHVGILYFVALYFFSFFGKNRYVKIIRLVAILLLLWSYAFITGLSPSVIRAALMFSLLLLGQSFQRKSNVYNILAVSAFILLFIHPVWIRDAGFQLSYLAVLGIVALYRPLYLLAATGIGWVDKIWSLLVVSVAALAGTFPLTLYYFHRFPLYAPLTNILVIPLVTVFIYVGLAFFLLQPFPWLAGLMAHIMMGLANGLLFITQKSLTLPAAVISPVFLHTAGVLILYLLTLSLVLIFLRRKPAGVLFLQMVMLAGVVVMLIRESDTVRKNRLAVFNIPHGSVCLLSSGKTGVLVGDTGTEGSAFYLKNIAGSLGLKKLVPATAMNGPAWENACKMRAKQIYLHKGFFRVGSATGFILNDSTAQKFKREIPVDYLIFSGKKWWLLKRQLNRLRPGMIILDATVPGFTVKKIRQICSGRNLYVVREQGPFVWEE